MNEQLATKEFLIPKRFYIGGQEINVEQVDDWNDNLGEANMWNGYIKLANRYKGYTQSETCKKNTFCHELVHLILDIMGEHDLSSKETFVSCFGGFLCIALTTMEYEDNK